MQSRTILAKRMRYVVPFRFDPKQETISNREAILMLDEKTDEYGGKWVQTSVRSGEQDVYEYILDSFDESGYSLESNIGAMYMYKAKDGILPQLTYHHKLNRDTKEELTSYDFKIKEAGMFLFGTGIGLLWYEIDAGEKMNSEELIEFNFYFKELNLPKTADIFTCRNYTGLILGDWISRILRPMECKIRFYSSRENINRDNDAPVFVPDKALLFNYFVFDEADKDKEVRPLIDYSFYLTKGYKGSYKIPSNAEDKMFKPFDNVFIFVSKEGVGYYVESDKESKKYYTGDKGLFVKIMNDYFLIYILILQQSYALLKYAETIGETLTANPEQYLDSGLYNTDETAKKKNEDFFKLERKVRELTTQVNVFLTKNVRASVSHIQHHNDFYNYAKKQLNVLGETKDLTMGLESLQGLLRDSKQQWEASEEGARDEKINLTLGLFSIVAFVSAVYDCESLIKDFFMSNEGTSTGESLMWHVLPYGIIFIVLVVAWLLLVIRLVKNTSKKREEGSENKRGIFKRIFQGRKDARVEKLKKEKEEIIAAASTDALTGVYNRMGLMTCQKTMLHEAKKKRKNLYVCSVDLNGLKRINDTYGHAAGDDAIIKMANILKDAVPEGAKVFRTGGDEFQILGVFDRTTDAPQVIKRKIDNSIKKYNEKVDEEHKIGASYGWEMRIPDRQQTDITDMFRIADEKMYIMKYKTDPYRRD